MWADETRPRARAARGPGPDGELRAYRHEGFWECMDTYKDAVLLNDLVGPGRAALEAVGLMRSAFVTGAYGLLGTGLAKALLDAGARSPCCGATCGRARHWSSRASRTAATSSPATSPTCRSWTAPWASTRSTPSSTSPRRRSSAPRSARRCRPGRRTSAAPGWCSRPAGGTRSRAWSWRPRTRPTAPTTSCPTARAWRCSRSTPTTSPRRRPTSSRGRTSTPTGCPSRRPASPTSTAAGTPTARGWSPRPSPPRSGPRAGHPLRRLARARLPLRRGRGRRVPGGGRRRCRGRRLGGEAFNAGGEEPHGVRDVPFPIQLRSEDVCLSNGNRHRHPPTTHTPRAD